MRTKICWAAILWLGVLPARAEDLPQPETASPGVIVEGSGDVSIGGQSAARVGDTTSTGNVVVEGSPDVFINGKPAAVQGGATNCGGIVIGGSSNVFINGKPAASTGDVATGCTDQ
ncbi:MAG: PAAR domain-containing protein [Hyphomicrobiaceae bacterium]